MNELTNKTSPNFYRSILPMVGLFTFLAIGIRVFSHQLELAKISPSVLMIANILLLIICSFNLKIHNSVAKNKSATGSVNMIMLATMFKFFSIAITVLCYVVLAKEPNIYGVIGGMFIYVLYTAIEVKTVLKLKK